MVVFHFVRDLETFRVIPAGTTLSGGWAVFARLVAGTFLFLAGVSLVLAHRSGFRPAAYLRRLATIATAALLVTVATSFAIPSRTITFGILHVIALASVVCLPFVWLSPWCSAAAAVAVWIVAAVWGRALIDAPWAAFTGLGTIVRPSLDYLPAFPWLAPALLGIAVALALDLGRRRPPTPEPAWGAALACPGRHGLAIYLLHQPVMLAAIWLVLNLTP